MCEIFHPRVLVKEGIVFAFFQKRAASAERKRGQRVGERDGPRVL